MASDRLSARQGSGSQNVKEPSQNCPNPPLARTPWRRWAPGGRSPFRPPLSTPAPSPAERIPAPAAAVSGSAAARLHREPEEGEGAEPAAKPTARRCLPTPHPSLLLFFFSHLLSIFSISLPPRWVITQQQVVPRPAAPPFRPAPSFLLVFPLFSFFLKPTSSCARRSRPRHRCRWRRSRGRGRRRWRSPRRAAPRCWARRSPKTCGGGRPVWVGSSPFGNWLVLMVFVCFFLKVLWKEQPGRAQPLPAVSPPLLLPPRSSSASRSVIFPFPPRLALTSPASISGLFPQILRARRVVRNNPLARNPFPVPFSRSARAEHGGGLVRVQRSVFWGQKSIKKLGWGGSLPSDAAGKHTRERGSGRPPTASRLPCACRSGPARTPASP